MHGACFECPQLLFRRSQVLRWSSYSLSVLIHLSLTHAFVYQPLEAIKFHRDRGIDPFKKGLEY